ncbi:MAG: hypothetical protein JWQ09_5610 [Segetibacter sp.]|nr:hypothetical protein [Segetibacter sp.]
MANNKVGFDYYSSDTNRYQDIKIKKLKKTFKGTGLAIHDFILNEIYRLKGYWIKWDDSTAFDVADYFEIKETLVNEVVNYCCSVGLFDRELFTSERVLTSAAIQKRFLQWTKLCRRQYSKIEKYKLTTDERKMCEECGKMHEESFKMCAVCRKEKKREVDILSTIERDTVFENSILNYFGFNETNNHDKAVMVHDFTKFLTLKNKIEYFTGQFRAYCAVKNKTGYKHSLQNYLGQQSEQYAGGAWDAENWQAKLNDLNNSGTQGIPITQPARKTPIDHRNR